MATHTTSVLQVHTEVHKTVTFVPRRVPPDVRLVEETPGTNSVTLAFLQMVRPKRDLTAFAEERGQRETKAEGQAAGVTSPVNRQD